MHLRGNETVLRIYRRHTFPYLLRVLGLICAAAPFYFVLFAISQSVTQQTVVKLGVGISLLFLAVFLYMSFIYWMDRLVVTNFRVIFIDWKLLNVSSEVEAELDEIQDIHTSGKGILSLIPFLNYGTLSIETAASNLSIRFDYAPDPNVIKVYIFSVK